MDLLEDTGELETDVPHRPGKLYKFSYDKYQKKERKKWFGIDF
jgi:8-oxo-dGTP diphosphatase